LAGPVAFAIRDSSDISKKSVVERVRRPCRSEFALCHYRTEILRFRELPSSDACRNNGAVGDTRKKAASVVAVISSRSRRGVGEDAEEDRFEPGLCGRDREVDQISCWIKVGNLTVAAIVLIVWLATPSTLPDAWHYIRDLYHG
jgi:hypothetical protein